jgi:hypothetical protein
MRVAWVLVLAAACHKAPPPAADALWDLAPDGTELGIVATPRAMTLASHALDTVRALVATPDFAPMKPAFDEVVSGIVGSPDATLADAGLASDRGFAMFITHDGVVGAIPVADRAKFVALKHGTLGSGGSAEDSINGASCKPVRDLYVCATSDAMFARVGKASLRGKVALAGTRGDLELYAPGLDAFGGAGDLALVATLSRGQIELVARWAGTPAGVFAQLGSAAAPKLDATGDSGFAALNVAPLLADLPDVPLAGGITFGQLAKALRGPITATVAGGTTDLQLHVALADPVPVQTLLDHCGEIPLDPPPTSQNGTCRLALPALSQLDVDAWIENGELRVGAHRGPAPAGQPAALTVFGRELATGDWTAMFWGRGTMLSTHGVTPMSGDIPAQAAMSIHLMALVSEAGAALKVDGTGVRVRAILRTIWTNPPALADKLAAIDGAEVLRGGSAAAQLATPGTPFAIDYAAGQGGLMIPAATAGFGAAVVLPAVLAMFAPATSPEAAPPGTPSSDPGSASPPP